MVRSFRDKCSQCVHNHMARRANVWPEGPMYGPKGQQIHFELVINTVRSTYSKLRTLPKAGFGGFEGLSQSPGSRCKIITIFFWVFCCFFGFFCVFFRGYLDIFIFSTFHPWLKLETLSNVLHLMVHSSSKSKKRSKVV